jgi:TonB family protein
MRAVVVGLLWLSISGCMPARGAVRREDIGYHAAVYPRNTGAIGDAAQHFAEYFKHMHRRVHPIYADTLLARLDALPPNNALQAPSLNVTVELVLSGADGSVVERSIVRSSAASAFDRAALNAVQQAAPFGPAPPDIRSFDGNVHLYWELRRDAMACSTMGMQPLLLRAP